MKLVELWKRKNAEPPPVATAPINPTAIELATSAQSFILQPFWPELVRAINEQRDAAGAKLSNPGVSWDEDARNLEHWRAVNEIVNFVVNYPVQIIEGGQE